MPCPHVQYSDKVQAEAQPISKSIRAAIGIQVKHRIERQPRELFECALDQIRKSIDSGELLQYILKKNTTGADMAAHA
jgi:hypothetical protein